MTVNYGPSIVTGNLLIALDSANTRSYPKSGSLWSDISGNTNNGTLQNSPTYSTDGSGTFVFDGTTNYVTTPYVQTSITTYTIDVWFKTSNLISRVQRAFLQDRGTTGSPVSVTMGIGPVYTTNRGGDVFICADGNGVLTQISTIGNSYNDSKWHNMIGVFSQPSGTTVTAASFAIYMDGIRITAIDTSLPAFGSTASPLTGASGAMIGFHPVWGTYYGGSISSIKVYNIAFTADQVTQNFNAYRGRYGI